MYNAAAGLTAYQSELFRFDQLYRQFNHAADAVAHQEPVLGPDDEGGREVLDGAGELAHSGDDLDEAGEAVDDDVGPVADEEPVLGALHERGELGPQAVEGGQDPCLLYTSDAADE